MHLGRGGGPYLNPNDIDLIRNARKGSTEAFTAIVRNYKNFVYRTVFAILQNRQDTEDVAQEVFIKAYRSLAGLRDERTFPSWLAQIATRTALDWVQSKQKNQTIELDSEKFVVNDDIHRAANIRLDLENALGHLSEEHRMVTVLRADGFDYEEIAQILDIPIGTVRSRLHNARMHLRQLLQDERGDNE